MTIKELEKAVITEIRDYIQAHAVLDLSDSQLDSAPLLRMVEIHFSHLNAQVDVDKFMSESVEGIHKYVKHIMKRKTK